MEIYLREKFAQHVIDISNDFKVEAKIIGRVESSSKKQVTIKNLLGEFVYT